jgi:hypothetical protein
LAEKEKKRRRGDWIVDCGLWRLQLFPCRYPIPACVCSPGPRICGHSPIAASWIAGLLDPPPTSEVPRLTQPPPRSINSPASAASRPFKKGGLLPQNNRRRKDAIHLAAPHTTAPVQSTTRRTGETGDVGDDPGPKQVQGWKSRTHERRPVPTLTGASQQPGGVFLPILLQPGHTLFKVLQTNRSSC